MNDTATLAARLLTVTSNLPPHAIKSIEELIRDYERIRRNNNTLSRAAIKLLTQLDRSVSTRFMNLDLEELREAIAQAEPKL